MRPSVTASKLELETTERQSVQAAWRPRNASYIGMKPDKHMAMRNAARTVRAATIFMFACATIFYGEAATAQDASGPLTPPPVEEHNVHRVTTTETTEPPPPMPPTEIIKEFAAKEEKFLRARVQYGYKKTVKVTEFGKDGQPNGEFQITTQVVVDPDGKMYEKTVEKQQSSLHTIDLTPANSRTLGALPAYPLIPSQLAKYELRYVGTEKVDEVDCYIFDAKPKFLERAHALFQGVVWVDKQYLEVVKTYGKWVTDLGDEHGEDLPFVNFETYRENVDGKYWFPNYARSDEYLHTKDAGDIPVRLVIKWTEFKPLTAVAAPLPAAKP